MPSGVRLRDRQRRRALGNHRLNVAQTQRVCCIPASAHQHDFQWIVQPLEHLAQLAYHCQLGFHNHLFIVRHGLLRQNLFNSWLNMHRPCRFATEVVSEKGKIIKRYNHQDVKTPLECLALLNEKGLVTFKAGITLEDLLAQASEKTDLQAAREMQHEGRFVCFVQQAQTQTAGLKPVLSLSKGHSNQGGVVRKKTMRAGGPPAAWQGPGWKKIRRQKSAPLNFNFQPGQTEQQKSSTQAPFRLIPRLENTARLEASRPTHETPSIDEPLGA